MYRRLFGALEEALQDGNEAFLLSSMRLGVPLEELVDSMMTSSNRGMDKVRKEQEQTSESTEVGIFLLLVLLIATRDLNQYTC